MCTQNVRIQILKMCILLIFMSTLYGICTNTKKGVYSIQLYILCIDTLSNILYKICINTVYQNKNQKFNNLVKTNNRKDDPWF